MCAPVYVLYDIICITNTAIQCMKYKFNLLSNKLIQILIQK